MEQQPNQRVLALPTLPSLCSQLLSASMNPSREIVNGLSFEEDSDLRDELKLWNGG